MEGRPYGTPLAGLPDSASDATEGYNLGPRGWQVTPPWHPVSGRARFETLVYFTHQIASTVADKVPLSWATNPLTSVTIKGNIPKVELEG